ncbi:MAG TPA: hypothetical protein VMA86_01080 [Acetobacteraceae bacterium]|nr:hypothetical protein [Acetobacteraceae bacterium]
MLAGEAVAAIWNGIAAEARADFYAWHVTEHMPERAGIPGFLRGRRYIAADEATVPEFFTLYEAASFSVLQGQDYANRLNDPTPWTRAVTAQFRDTARSLARVAASHGPGMGGMILTHRFAGISEIEVLQRLVADTAAAPRVTGAHLCVTDAKASGLRTTETADRTDITDPPGAFILLEATDMAALAPLLPDAALLHSGARPPIRRGLYRLEYVRGKTACA